MLIHTNASPSSLSPPLSPSLWMSLSPSWLEFDLRVFSLQRAGVLIGSQDNSSPPTDILAEIRRIDTQRVIPVYL